MGSSLDRRTFFLRTAAGAAGLALGTTACARLEPDVDAVRPAPSLRLPPVRVSAHRVIRTVAGLRPFRPSGFVVRTQRLDDLPVVHNYGHGGGGITLAWGSSQLAADRVAELDVRHVAVLGAGILGLTSARILQDRGYRVTIHARDLPPDTTSNVGGGQWSPFTVHDNSQASSAYMDRFEAAARRSHRYYQTLVGAGYGVRWVDNYSLRSGPSSPPTGRLSDLYPNRVELGPGEHPFPTPYVVRHSTMFIEPGVFLPAVTRDFHLRGGEIRVREFHDPAELRDLGVDAVVNCTGLGSRALFGDDELMPIKGQLVILLPQPEVDYLLLGGGAYMFPRSDGIVLGGSQERGEWSLEPTPEVVERILEQNREIFDAMIA
jgi:D-amino-acid oxidase